MTFFARNIGNLLKRNASGSVWRKRNAASFGGGVQDECKDLNFLKFFMILSRDIADPPMTKLFRAKVHVMRLTYSSVFKVKEILQIRSCHATFLSSLFPAKQSLKCQMMTCYLKPPSHLLKIDWKLEITLVYKEVAEFMRVIYLLVNVIPSLTANGFRRRIRAFIDLY